MLVVSCLPVHGASARDYIYFLAGEPRRVRSPDIAGKVGGRSRGTRAVLPDAVGRQVVATMPLDASLFSLSYKTFDCEIFNSLQMSFSASTTMVFLGRHGANYKNGILDGRQ